MTREFYAENIAFQHNSNSDSSSIFFDSHSSNPTAIIALDEVGRGCLAGPVVAGASLWIKHEAAQLDSFIEKPWISMVNDSKKMSKKQRDKCFDLLKLDFPHLNHQFSTLTALSYKDMISSEHKTIALKLENLSGSPIKCPKFSCVAVEIAHATEEEIDEVNIWSAVQLAMGRAMLQLHNHEKYRTLLEGALITIDGKLPIRVPKPFQPLQQVTCVGGDAHFISIGTSSVTAKVARDRFMTKLHQKFPHYGLDNHMGYATEKHRTALLQHGPASIHRRSFLSKILPPAN